MPDFCHLHCHTHYSLLDGAARIKTLVQKAREHGSPALAITDHGNLFGVPEFHATAKKAGIKPIIGCEFYLSRVADGRSQRPHALSSGPARQERRRVPKSDRALVGLLSRGLLLQAAHRPRDRSRSTAPDSSRPPAACRVRYRRPCSSAARRRQRRSSTGTSTSSATTTTSRSRTTGSTSRRRSTRSFCGGRQEYGVKAIATNDVHYVEEEDAAAQDVLLCLQTGRDLYDPKRMRFEERSSI